MDEKAILMAGIDCLPHGGKVIITNQDGRALCGLDPDAAEVFCKRMVDAIAVCRTGKKIIEV
jgi:hypothetical protein